jgi:UDP-N-acetylglucosamine--N-acetylmuramyl-(pentapeptide) pyrophosphoryl-undecaprenol N-acetylglucosamine transferase
VKPFIDDMASSIAGSDLVISRAGAGAVSEICSVGRPALFIPYPFAGDHQKHNADSLAREGAALWLPNAQATPERLASELRALVSDPTKLPSMAANAQRLGRPQAARTIAEDLLTLAGHSSASLPTTHDPRPTTSDPNLVKLTEVA